MSLAAETRDAVRANPFVYEALRAGVLNYSAAARFLDVGETDAVVAALRRYAEDLPDYERVDRDVRVTMQSGLEADCDHSEALLAVGEQAIGGDGGSLTGILCTGGVDADLLRRVLGRLHAESITVEAAGVGDVAMVVVVGRRDGPNALRAIEATTAAV